MFDKNALSAAMLVAFLKDANITGAEVDAVNKTVTMHLDEGEPDVSFDLSTMLSIYQEKELGKGLSTNDFTDALKTRLEEIQDQVQVNWDETDNTHIEFIRNKPDVYLPVQAVRDILDSLSLDTDGNLLIEGQPVDSVRPDWNETNPDHKAYIANKPILHDHSNKAVLDNLSATGSVLMYNGVIVSGVQSDWSQTDSTKPEYINNKPTLYEPANQDVLDALGYNAQNLLTYNGVVVDTQSQSDWDEDDSTKPWFIRNKPDVWLPSNELRTTLEKFDEVGNRVRWNTNELAYKEELINSTSVPIYGLVTAVTKTTE